jgi:hypothetical protein
MRADSFANHTVAKLTIQVGAEAAERPQMFVPIVNLAAL